MAQHAITDGPRPKHAQLSDVLAELAVARARPRRGDPVRARADDDVRRLARHGPQGDRQPGRRRPAPPDPRQGHLRRPAARREPPAPGVVLPGHAPPRADPVDPAAAASTRSARPPTSSTALRLGARGTAWRIDRVRLADGQPMALEQGWYPTLAAARPRHRGPHRLALHALRRRATASPSTPPSRRCGARPPRARPRAASRRRSTPRSSSSAASPAPAGRPAGARRLALPRRPLPGPHDASAAHHRRRSPEPRTGHEHHRKGSDS